MLAGQLTLMHECAPLGKLTAVGLVPFSRKRYWNTGLSLKDQLLISSSMSSMPLQRLYTKGSGEDDVDGKMLAYIREFQVVSGFPRGSGTDGCHYPVSPPTEYASDYHN